MKTNLDRLLQKRKQLEQQIQEAQQLEKRKAQVRQLALAELDKQPKLLHADEQYLRASLSRAFAEIAKNVPAA